MSDHEMCPLERAGLLESPVRRLLHSPGCVLGGFVRPGMTVLDFGCGPGFFTMKAAEMVGPQGRVVAADLQQGMLDILAGRLSRDPVGSRVTLHRCEKDAVGVTGPVDFALAFFVVHEIRDKQAFFAEMKGILRPGGKMLIAEPLHHVDAAEFDQMKNMAVRTGFVVEPGPFMLMARRVVLVAP